MRLARIAGVALVVLAAVWAAIPLEIAAAADGDQFIGTWKGTWEGGGGSGRFDMTLARGSDGKLAVTVSVGMDTGEYNAAFSTVTMTAGKLAGAYDYPPDPQGEVTIAGSFDPKNATGTWSLAAKGQPGGQSIAGTWKVAKQWSRVGGAQLQTVGWV
jgi:hypothetical protein